MIPKIYDGDRVVRILGLDGEEAFAPINKSVMGIDGQPELVNDITTAKFDVRIRRGPSYANAKAEAKAALSGILQAAPQMMTVIGDLWADTLDIQADVKQKMVERIKKIIPPNISGEPGPKDPVAEAQQRGSLAKMEADTRLAQGRSDEQVLKNNLLASQVGALV